MNQLPQFINQVSPIGDPQCPAPYAFRGVNIRAYPLQADYMLLQKVCDRFLNQVSGRVGCPVTWHPLSNLVNLKVLEYQKMYTVASDYADTGVGSQREVLIEIMVVGSDGQISSFVPFCIVDNDWSVIAGREVLGYPKVQGRIKLKNGRPIKVKIRGLEKFGPNEKQKKKLLLKVSNPKFQAFQVTDDPDNVRQYWPFGPIEQLYGRGSIQPLDTQLQNSMRDLAGRALPAVTVKQFRDAQFHNSACYQNLITFDYRLKRFEYGSLHPPSTIKIKDFVTYPVQQLLGLNPTGADTIESELTWVYCADFELSGVQNLTSSHSAPGGSTSTSGLSGYCGGMFDGARQIAAGMLNCYADMLRIYANGWLKTANGAARCVAGAYPRSGASRQAHTSGK